jgi:hypothetical protein
MKRLFTTALIMLFIVGMLSTSAEAQRKRKKHYKGYHKSEVVVHKPVQPVVRMHNHYKPFRPVHYRRGHVWIKGHWVFNNRTRSYVWIEGKYVKKRRHRVWIDGYWVRVRHGWRYIPGYWA